MVQAADPAVEVCELVALRMGKYWSASIGLSPSSSRAAPYMVGDAPA